jgi:hypothetical protein
MARSSKLRVMISSRCNDRFPPGSASGKTLTDIRRELKKEIEAETVFGRKAFEAWINEDCPPKGGTWDSWDTCIKAVKDCDILLVLSNGNAGWAGGAGDIGICHAELATALSCSPGKVWLISLGDITCTATPEGKRNKRFQEFVSTQSLFRGGVVKTENDLKKRVREALHDAVVDLVQKGVVEASRGKFYSGAALDWDRLDFESRRDQMRSIIRDTLQGRSGTKPQGDHDIVNIGGREVLVVSDAIPAAMSISAARERVGQPFLHDHLLVGSLKRSRGGPVHIIACHKGVTETQALRMLGFPDATVVNAPFGIYIADGIQRIQLVLISGCRDESTTRHGIQRFFDWLEQTGEDLRLAQRAVSRAKIVTTIAIEMTTSN